MNVHGLETKWERSPFFLQAYRLIYVKITLPLNIIKKLRSLLLLLYFIHAFWCGHYILFFDSRSNTPSCLLASHFKLEIGLNFHRMLLAGRTLNLEMISS